MPFLSIVLASTTVQRLVNLPRLCVSAAILGALILSPVVLASTNVVKAYAEPISWAKTYGGVGVDAFQMIQQTTDGGYIAAGYTETLGTEPGALLMKLDEMGTPEWQETFSGTGNEEFSAVRETDDGGFVAAGGINAFGSSRCLGSQG